MNIAVCDDEKMVREELCNELVQLDDNAHIKSFSSGEELLEAEEPFDMILLDIQMEGINGIEVAKTVRARYKDSNVIIVFISAVKEYVFDAFDVGAFHYLLKPINHDKLREVYDRALKEQKNHVIKSEKLLLKLKKKSISLDMNDIIYVENQLKKLIIHTYGQNIEFYGSMRELEQRTDGRFYRCHRGYLVNMDYIAEYTRDSIGIKNGETIYLSKEKYADFVRCYMHYLKGGGQLLCMK